MTDSTRLGEPHAARRATYKKRQRVIRSSDFTRGIRSGTVAADGTLVVFVIPSPNGPSAEPRMGVTIPRRTGNAVIRNRWKRWIRESFRTVQHDLPRGWDIVIRPKKDAAGNWESISKSVSKLVQKAVQRSGNRGQHSASGTATSEIPRRPPPGGSNRS